ncbi:hypothetical protein D3C79_516780 [compost metagenome]
MLGQLLLAGHKPRRQPLVPGLDEALRQAAADKVATAGQLAVEANATHHNRSGRLKPLSTRLLNGLKALLARSS